MRTELFCYDDLTDVQRQQLERIEVLPEQQLYSGDIQSALSSLLDRPTPAVRGFALLVERRPAGFLLLKRGALLPPWADKDSATLHALQIDFRMQGRGLGKLCLHALPEVVRRIWPDVTQLMLSVDADNEAARGLYLGLGWVDTGNGYRGRVGYERRLVLDLRTEANEL
ncbi:GNAT family N-acetyltransferase [Pseudomonas sp. NA-150]|uniref:GNAT family N-acetyltransferase n=1 Tax=Pseudomonas sp. NA-150 TaxID=3367525 RepID=UPI0037C597F4